MADTVRSPPEAGMSQEALISLDPMPIRADTGEGLTRVTGADGDIFSKDDQKSSSSGTSSVLGLSGSGHSSLYYLARVQRYSSFAFTIFTSVHFVTTAVVPLVTWSVPASESYLLLAREIYQTRVSEPLLVAVPVVAHAVAGLGLRLVRRGQNLRRYGSVAPALWLDARSPVETRASVPEAKGTQLLAATEERQQLGWLQTQLQRWQDRARLLASRFCSGWPPLSAISASGYGFLIGLAAHVAVNRILPLVVEGDSADIGLAYVAHGFSRHPAVAWLSYTVFLGLASSHMVWGCARYLNIAQRASWCNGSDRATKKRRRTTWLAIQAGVLLVFGVWAAGGLGVVARSGRMQGWTAKVYDGLYDVAGL